MQYLTNQGYNKGTRDNNSSLPSAAHMRQWIWSALVQILACRLFGAKPLSKPMLVYCQLDPREQSSVKFKSKYKNFHSRKCIWKCRLRDGGHFVQGDIIKSASLYGLLPSITACHDCSVFIMLLSVLPKTPVTKSDHEDKNEELLNKTNRPTSWSLYQKPGWQITQPIDNTGLGPLMGFLSIFYVAAGVSWWQLIDMHNINRNNIGAYLSHGSLENAALIFKSIILITFEWHHQSIVGKIWVMMAREYGRIFLWLYRPHCGFLYMQIDWLSNWVQVYIYRTWLWRANAMAHTA